MPLSVPIASTRLIVPAASFNLLSGAPAFAVGATVQVCQWLLDPTTQESVSAGVDFPDDWQTFATFAWLMTVGTTASGNVRMSAVLPSVVDTQVSNISVGGAVTVAIVGGTTNRVHRLALETALPRPSLNTIVNLNVVRVAADAADSYAADIGLVAVELVKVS